MERPCMKRPSSYKAPAPEVRRRAQEAEYVGSPEHKMAAGGAVKAIHRVLAVR